MTVLIVTACVLAFVGLLVTYRPKRVPLSEAGYIWAAHGRYHVMVNGHQVGVWTKRRWAERDLREQLRDLEVTEEER